MAWARKTKASEVVATFIRNPSLTSGQLARIVGVTPEYARTALYRANLRTIYRPGLGKGGYPARRATS